MNLSELIKTTDKRKKRLGRGHGSGRVKTSGRGQKGQKARGKIPAFFEGGQLPLTKKLPFVRGKLRNQSLKKSILVVNLGQLNSLKENTVVDRDLLIKEKIVKTKEKKIKVKILGSGELSVALTIKLPVSKTALAKIEKAGGKVESTTN